MAMCPNGAICQTAYVKTAAQGAYWHPSFLDGYTDGSLAVGMFVSQGPQVETRVAKLDPMGNTLWSKRSNTLSVYNIAATDDGGMVYIAATESGQLGGNRELLVKLDADGNLDWHKYLLFSTLSFSQQCGLDVAMDGAVIVSAHDGISASRRLLCARVGTEGDFDWAKGVSIEGVSCDARTVKSLADGTVAVGGMMENAQGAKKAIVLKMDAQGIVKWAKSYAGFALTGLNAFPDGKLLITGTVSDSSAVIIGTAETGEVNWGYSLPILPVAQFSRHSATVAPDGSVVLAAVLPNRTASLVKMTAQGTVIGSKGYTKATIITSPPAVYDDGAVALLITSRQGAFFSSKGLIIKTDSDGLTPSCEVSNVCLSLSTFETAAADEAWETENMTFQQFGPPAVYSVSMAMEDICDPLPTADPVFYVPEAICIGDSITPIAPNQALADSWAWHFEGGTPSASVLQSPSAVVFQDTGQYALTQTVHSNYCADSFTVRIDVLPLPSVGLPADTVICGEAYYLNVTTDGIAHYEWDDGGTSPMREIHSGGIYEIRLSNGLCENTERFRVSFLSEQYPDLKLDLGKDTTVCGPQFLTLDASVPHASAYLWNNGTTGPARAVHESGVYQVEVQIGDCLLKDTISVLYEDCKAKVFIPNAFSPNGDGRNDLFAPLTNDAILLRMAIYDKWGGLVYQSDRPTAAWNGKNGSAPVPAGTYLYLCRFMNIRSQELFEVGGDVNLIR